MQVREIHWMAEDEAEVIVTDGENELLCFCHPCSLTVEAVIADDLKCFEVDGVVRAERKEGRIEKLSNGYFAYNFTGQLVSKAEGRVRIGDFLLKISVRALPGDIEDKEHITFSCRRVDIY